MFTDDSDLSYRKDFWDMLRCIYSEDAYPKVNLKNWWLITRGHMQSSFRKPY